MQSDAIQFTPAGNCTLAGQNFQGMDEVIDYLRANPQNSKKEGSPKYVAAPSGLDWGLSMAFSQPACFPLALLEETPST